MHVPVGVHPSSAPYLAAPRVGLCVLLGVGHHVLDLVFAQAARRLDHNLLLLASVFLACRHIDNAVGVNVKRHLNLRRPARGRRQANQVELSEQLVVSGHLALALQHLDLHLGLHVGGGRELLRLLGRDGCVAVDELGEHAAQRLNAQRQRRHIQQQHVRDLARQNTALDSSAHGDRLVRVDALAGRAAEDLLDNSLHLGHARLPADQDDVIDLRLAEAGVLEALLARPDCAALAGKNRKEERGLGCVCVKLMPNTPSVW